MTARILVIGSTAPDLRKSLEKITKVHQKTDFSFAIIVGDVFPEADDDTVQAVLNGSISIPLPTYFTVGDHSLPQAVQDKLAQDGSGEVCPNLFFQGRRAFLKTSEGIRIVFIGGRQVQSEEYLTKEIGDYDPLYKEAEASSLRGNHDAHIFISNQWPQDIEISSKIPLPEGHDTKSTSQIVANICATLKPRYHFSSSPSGSWTREPFTWPMDYASETSESQVTRFQSLAGVDRPNKEWFAAFNLDITKPPSTDGAQKLAPFTVSTTTKRKRPENGDGDNYRFRNGNNYQDLDRPPRHRGKRQNRTPYNPDDCFMCIGKPQFDQAMLISIGDESILTSGKGSLPLPETFPQLQSTGHLLIIPMYHAADESAHGQRATDDLTREFAEMTRYRHALHNMIASKNAANPTLPPLGAVCWEVNRTGIRHFHWQYLVCPADLIDRSLVDAAFKLTAEKSQHDNFRSCDPDQPIPSQRNDFFRVWIWSPTHTTSSTPSGANPGSTPILSAPDAALAISNGADTSSSTTPLPTRTAEKSMFFPLAPSERFNIQFGREVMAGLLKLEDRANWRDVPSKPGDEAKDAETWKSDFGEWDFAMV